MISGVQPGFHGSEPDDDNSNMVPPGPSQRDIEPASPAGARGGVTEEDINGGSSVDTFDDTTDVHSMYRVEHSNGGFELSNITKNDGFEGSGVSAYWTTFGGGTIQLDSSKSHSGSKSIHVDGISSSYSTGISHAYSSLRQGNISIWVYDPMNINTGSALFRVNNKADGGGNTDYYIAIRDTYTKYYIRCVDLSGNAWVQTSVTRTLGWHQFGFTVNSTGTTPWIDGVVVGQTDTIFKNFDTVKANLLWNSPHEVWYDDFRFESLSPFGYVNSTTITLPAEMKWDRVIVGSTSPLLTKPVQLTILDGSSRLPVSGYTDLDSDTSPEVDISGLDRTSIALRVKLQPRWNPRSSCTGGSRGMLPLRGGTRCLGVPNSKAYRLPSR